MTDDTKPSLIVRSEQVEISGLGHVLARSRESPAIKALEQAAKFGDQEPLYVAAAVLALVGIGLRRPRLVLAGVRMGAAVAISDALKSLTKRAVARTRPRELAVHGAYRRKLGGSKDKADQSFPSGHVAATLAAALALKRVYPSTGPIGATIAAALGLTRVLQGEHWPTDVAAGAAVGGLSETVSEALVRRLERLLAKAWSKRGSQETATRTLT